MICYMDNDGVGMHIMDQHCAVHCRWLCAGGGVCMSVWLSAKVCVCDMWFAWMCTRILSACVFCVILCLTVCARVYVSACVHSDDPDILVSWLMRCEDECCRWNAARKMTMMMMMMMIGITLCVVVVYMHEDGWWEIWWACLCVLDSRGKDRAEWSSTVTHKACLMITPLIVPSQPTALNHLINSKYSDWIPCVLVLQ